MTDTEPLIGRQALSCDRQPSLASACDIVHTPVLTAVQSGACTAQSSSRSSSQIRKHASPGLEFLFLLDKLLVTRKLEVLEILTGIETKNRYNISSMNGEVIFSAHEESDFCDRNCCPGSVRAFDMRIQDTEGRVVMMLSRRLACDSCCFPCCCMQRMEVASPPGNVVGYIVQEWSVFHPKFRIEDATGEVVMRMEGPFCQVTCGASIDFSIFSNDQSLLLARIQKITSCFRRKQVIADAADNFEISFKHDLSVGLKSMVLGACFLIDFMYNDRI